MSPTPAATVVVIGGGPAGLMAAEAATQCGAVVHLYDAMPSCGRKLLLAGVGGLNLTHSSVGSALLAAYGEHGTALSQAVSQFDSQAIRDWARELGCDTFVGSSGRVFPSSMKAAPLLRHWLHRLRASGASIHPRHRWMGWTDDQNLRFLGPDGPIEVAARATVLACGGASWPRLGSDGAWTALLKARQVTVESLRPANCGFECEWSDYLKQRFAGSAVKSIAITTALDAPAYQSQRGEILLTEYGIEGSLTYALSAGLRDAIKRDGEVCVYLDLVPDLSHETLTVALARQKPSRSLSERVRRATRMDAVKRAVLHELTRHEDIRTPDSLARRLKSLPLVLLRPRPIDEAISSAGGLSFSELHADYMLRRLPGVFAAGEMLDWEAPTGGYLLTACLATGRVAGAAAARWISRH